jgi:hypothetical protein
MMLAAAGGFKVVGEAATDCGARAKERPPDAAIDAPRLDGRVAVPIPGG